MTPQDLKNSVLQRAIQGKLVPQDPNEGSGEELLRQIREEKSRLLKDGKIKKEKPLPDIADDEKPFEIPDNWVWVRLGDIFQIIMGQSPDGKSVSEGKEGIEFHQGKIFFGNKHLNYSNQKTIEPTKVVEPNTLLLCVRAPVGKINITPREICIGRGLCGVVPFVNMSVDFIFYWFCTFEKIFIQKAVGTTFVAITVETVKNQLFPLPPLSEQKRIVQKLESLQPHIESYGRAWTRLEELSTRFPSELRKSLLQRAIEGRLVARDPSEGTGADLLREIQKEKKRLVEEGKIKKEKPLPEITDDEKPFEIPGHWTWGRLGTICTKIVDGDHNPPKGEVSPTPYIMASSLNINNNTIVNLDRVRFLSLEQFIAADERTKVRPGDVLLTTVGTLGRSCVYRDQLNICFQRSVSVITTCIFNEYLKAYFDSGGFQNIITREAKGTAQRGYYLNQLCETLIPLPPLSEQKRIVSKLEELLPLCERLTVVRS